MFGSLNWSLIGVVALIVIGTFTANFISSSIKDRKIDKLTAELEAGRSALKIHKANEEQYKSFLKKWETEFENIQAELDEREKESRAASGEIERLKNVLAKHDLEGLTNRKPGLVGKAVNRGSDRAMQLLNCYSKPGADSCVDKPGQNDNLPLPQPNPTRKH